MIIFLSFQIFTHKSYHHNADFLKVICCSLLWTGGFAHGLIVHLGNFKSNFRLHLLVVQYVTFVLALISPQLSGFGVSEGM